MIRALDAARVESNLSKAELARRIGATLEIVRRLFTTSLPSPTISIVISVASALGLRLELVDVRGGRGKKSYAKTHASQ